MHWGDRPIGLIESDVGGTPIGRWAPSGSLDECSGGEDDDVELWNTGWGSLELMKRAMGISGMG